MKSYFSLNQNPDAKDLKQLAQKTGLSKRVLQVSYSTLCDKFDIVQARTEKINMSGYHSKASIIVSILHKV